MRSLATGKERKRKEKKREKRMKRERKEEREEKESKRKRSKKRNKKIKNRTAKKCGPCSIRKVWWDVQPGYSKSKKELKKRNKTAKREKIHGKKFTMKNKWKNK